jgi:DNA-directed RNA polymerase subunit RPC12/RpoP
MTAVSPSRDDDATTRAAGRCSGCGQTFAPTGRQVHCSTACRKRVFRARHAADVVVELPVRRAAADPTAPARTRREHTVYECPDCGRIVTQIKRRREKLRAPGGTGSQ